MVEFYRDLVTKKLEAVELVFCGGNPSIFEPEPRFRVTARREDGEGSPGRRYEKGEAQGEQGGGEGDQGSGREGHRAAQELRTGPVH